MEAIEVLFTGILRFSLVAFILLGACLCLVRWMKQPLERVRLVQISFVALLVTLALGAANVIPTIELAFLPAKVAPSQPARPVDTTIDAETALPPISQGPPSSALVSQDLVTSVAGNEAFVANSPMVVSSEETGVAKRFRFSLAFQKNSR